MDERDTTAVIDRALADGAASAVDPIERELEELTLLLAAEAQSPDPEFAATLERRVTEGFPRPAGRWHVATRAVRRARAAVPRLPAFGRRRLTALGAAASLIVVVAIAFSLSNDGTKEAALGGGDASKGASASELGNAAGSRAVAPDAAQDGARGAPDPEAPRARTHHLREIPSSRSFALPHPRGGFAPGTRDRRIERSASLALAAPEGRIDHVAASITTVTERNGGFVLRSSLTTGEEGLTTGGDFELRIPAAKLQRALRQLADLGQVRSRTQTGDDVTVAFVTAGDRLEAARAERRGLLQRLESAQTDVEAESLRLQLDANAARINRLRSQIRSLRVRTAYATVGVTLEAREGDGAAAPGDGLGGALDDAVDSLGDSLELTIRALGVVIPLGLVALALVLAARVHRRRRRAAALS